MEVFRARSRWPGAILGENLQVSTKNGAQIPGKRRDWRTVIFDCDGVLVDSEPIANRVLARHLGSIGLEMTLEEVMRRFVGKTRAGCIELAEEMLGHPVPADFGAKWDADLFETLRREVRPVEGVVELLQAMTLPYCVASNGTPDRMRMTLEAAGLAAFFDARTFTAAEVRNPKPAPDLFLHAARSMGTEPAHCVVIEDTVTGVRAAVAAGMDVFGYAGAPHAEPAALRAAGADVFTDMRSAPFAAAVTRAGIR
jgi:HAD superfamily hydrolase (TIGR01509 family)